jgi:hypothetical protein
VCDACYMGSGEPTNVVYDSKAHKSTSFARQDAPKIWDQHSNPEFCDECYDLFKNKNWDELGKRHQHSMQKILERGPRASDKP